MPTLLITVDEPGLRLDAFLAARVPELTRSQAQRLIDGGACAVDGRPAKASQRLKAGQAVSLDRPPAAPCRLEPEPMDIEIVFEDESLAVVNKPPGLVVHPAPGHARGTLVQGLLHRLPDLSGVGGVARPGIVHRLDKDTSGLMVVAKNDRVHQALAAAFKGRAVSKTYLCVILGAMNSRRIDVDAPIGRHPTNRKKMAVRPDGRSAASRLRLVRELPGPLSLAEVDIFTGRTHQIRVHAAHAGHPVLGDPVYGSPGRERGLVEPARGLALGLGRQMLHALRLAFAHPLSGADMSFTAAPPPDMAGLLAALGNETRPCH